MGYLLQLFAHGYDKWVVSGGRGEGGGQQAPKISVCLLQASIGLYQQQNKAKLSRLNCEN